MSVGGVGSSDLPVAIADSLAKAESAAPARPAALPEPAPSPKPALLADAFTRATAEPSLASRAVGDAFTPVAAEPAPVRVLGDAFAAPAEPAPAPTSLLKRALTTARAEPAPEPAPNTLLKGAFGSVAAQSDAAVADARGDVTDARQDLRQARRRVANTEAGTAKKAVAREELQDARQDLRAAKGDLTEAKQVDAAVDALGRRIASDSSAASATPEAFTPAVEVMPELVDPTPQPEAPVQEAAPEIAPGAENPAEDVDLPTPEDHGFVRKTDLPASSLDGLALGQEISLINQIEPRGRDKFYENADTNCAPATVAMLARTLPPETLLDGKPIGKMSDARLINTLGEYGQTDELGTSPNGVIAMAEELGLSTSTSHGVGFDQAYYDSVLAQGGSVVANGGYEFKGEMIGHFVLVTGKTTDGRYLVNDPLLDQVVALTPQQLDEFLRNNQAYRDGFSIGILP